MCVFVCVCLCVCLCVCVSAFDRVPLLQALRDMQRKGKKKRIQYREYSLTHLFQKYLMGHGQMSMIVCASSSTPDAPETPAVLEFAQLTAEIETNASDPAPVYKGYEEGRGMQCRLQRRARREANGGAVETSLSDIEEDNHNGHRFMLARACVLVCVCVCVCVCVSTCLCPCVCVVCTSIV